MTTYARALAEQPVAGKKLGRHIEHDPRSKNYPFEPPTGTEIQSVLWPRSGSPFDQGTLGSCTGNATAGAINTRPLHKRHHHILTELDAVELYELATTLDEFPGSYPPDDTGSSGLGAAKAAQQLGYIDSYQHAFDMATALQALMHGPLITGVSWCEGFDQPDAHGHVSLGGQNRGGHEFEIRGLVLGHDLTSYLDALVVAENSWGTSWGKRGLFYFTVADWATLLADQGDVTILQR